MSDVFQLSDNEDDDKFRDIQRLKAAVHYTVGKICEEFSAEEEEENRGTMEFSKQFIAALSETTFKYIGTMATDLELFAKHAKRTTINADDVKLLVRKSPPLLEHITSMSEQMAASAQEKKEKRKKKKTAEDL